MHTLNCTSNSTALHSHDSGSYEYLVVVCLQLLFTIANNTPSKPWLRLSADESCCNARQHDHAAGAAGTVVPAMFLHRSAVRTFRCACFAHPSARESERLDKVTEEEDQKLGPETSIGMLHLHRVLDKLEAPCGWRYEGYLKWRCTVGKARFAQRRWPGMRASSAGHRHWSKDFCIKGRR